MAGNLKSQLFSGVFYTALAKYSGVVISLVVAGAVSYTHLDVYKRQLYKYGLKTIRK